MKTYHDYVIKDGKFIGEFEKMYEDCEDPWIQSTQPNKYSRTAGILHIKKFDMKSILECGCGFGYYANWIYHDTGIIPKSIDISKNAIRRAKKLFPHLDFEVANVVTDLKNYKAYECVMFAEIIWYILPDLEKIFEMLRKEFKGKFLMVNQVFYKGTQKYGTEYFTNLLEFIDYVPFSVLGVCEAATVDDTTIETSTIFEIG